MTKVYIEYSNPQYARMFTRMGYEVVENPDECDFACFTGGADVSPALYGDSAHRYTGSDPLRDMEELKMFNMFKQRSVPMVGICRGAQFLNVLNGGRMYQHVENHTRDHHITDANTGETILVTSTHHQMMMPSNHGRIVAFSNLNGSREWFTGSVAERDVSDKDIEVVYYPQTYCLCFQPHPEFDGTEYSQMKDYFLRLLEEYLGT